MSRADGLPQGRTPSHHDTPEHLLPRMGELPVSSTRHYKSVTITKVSARSDDQSGELSGLQDPPDPEGATDKGRPAEGVLLTHEQGWFAKGVALGELVHTVCLAPGEITQLAVTTTRRSARGQAQDDVAARETASQEEDASSALEEVQDATAKESQHGSSFGRSTATQTQAGAGGILGGLGVSLGGATNSGVMTSVSHSSGSRDVASESNQNLHQTTEQQANLARSRRSTQIRELSEGESTELQTRVVANYNHVHALTMQYYQVLQTYELKTRVLDAERVLFLPMKVHSFLDSRAPDAKARPASIVKRFRLELATAARGFGDHKLAAALERKAIQGDSRKLRDRRAILQRQNLVQRLARVTKDASDARTALQVAQNRLLQAKDDLRNSTDTGGLLERTNKRRESAAASDEIRAHQVKLQDRQTEHEALERILTELRERQFQELGIPIDDEAAKPFFRLVEREGEAAAARASQASQAGGGEATKSPASRAGDEGDVGLDDAIVRAFSQAEMSDAELVDRLERHRLAYNQAIWMQLDPAVLLSLISDRGHEGQSLKGRVEPVPVAITGNLLGLKWHFDSPEEEAEFVKRHLDGAERQAPTSMVSLPTNGVFAEGVLGEGKGAEKLDFSRFWNWHDALPPIRPSEIEAIGETEDEATRFVGARAGEGFRLDLDPAQFIEARSNLAKAVEVAGKEGLFRDLSGSEITAKLQNFIEIAKDGATGASELAEQNLERWMKFQQNMLEAANNVAQPAPKLDANRAGGAMNAQRAAKAKSQGAPGPIAKTFGDTSAIQRAAKKVAEAAGGKTAGQASAGSGASGSDPDGAGGASAGSGESGSQVGGGGQAQDQDHKRRSDGHLAFEREDNVRTESTDAS